jgi:hypothetical protein
MMRRRRRRKESASRSNRSSSNSVAGRQQLAARPAMQPNEMSTRRQVYTKSRFFRTNLEFFPDKCKEKVEHGENISGVGGHVRLDKTKKISL